MHCPFCRAPDTKVIDSRLVGDGEQVRRRRECIACAERFTTFEGAELVTPRVIKSDNTRVPFDDNKLRASGEREVKSRLIGEMVMTELAKLDKVAYVRFASVYRDFQDVDAFRAEIDKLNQRDEPQA